jgi:predicted metal-binding membrane protein
MVAAMMLPASWPAIARFERSMRRFDHSGRALASFLAVFGGGWALLGLLAFGGDAILHRVVDATPWLAARPWLVQAGVLGLAAAYQLSPVKQRCLEGCRIRELAPRPPSAAGRTNGRLSMGLAAGWAHLLDCVGASGPLMIVMFAVGFADIAWMAVLTAVMAYEARGTHGQAARRLSAVGLAALALRAIVG